MATEFEKQQHAIEMLTRSKANVRKLFSELDIHDVRKIFRFVEAIYNDREREDAEEKEALKAKSDNIKKLLKEAEELGITPKELAAFTGTVKESGHNHVDKYIFVYRDKHGVLTRTPERKLSGVFSSELKKFAKSQNLEIIKLGILVDDEGKAVEVVKKAFEQNKLLHELDDENQTNNNKEDKKSKSQIAQNIKDLESRIEVEEGEESEENFNR